MNVQELKEKIRIAESNGDDATAEKLKKELRSMTING